MATTGGGGRHQVFYRYQDANGRIVIVDSESRVPSELRSQARRIELDGAPPNATAEQSKDPRAKLELFHAPSFMLGFGAALLLGTILFSFRSGGSRTLAKILGGSALLLVLGGAYLGWLRRSTGQSDSLVSSPAEFVDDARRAVQQVQQRREEQRRTLEEIEREAK